MNPEPWPERKPDLRSGTERVLVQENPRSRISKLEAANGCLEREKALEIRPDQRDIS